jgi:hypothetical protein
VALLGVAYVLISACGDKTSGAAADRASPNDAAATSDAASALAIANDGSAPNDEAGAAASDAATPDAPATPFTTWLRDKVPASATITFDSGTVKVLHNVAPGDTSQSIAKAYLDVTDVYYAKDLAAMIAKHGPLVAGTSVEIPHVLAAPYKDPEHDRMRWPADRHMNGIFITGAYAAILWPETLEHLSLRKEFNAVVLDAKDYQGPVNYPTKAKIAREIEADKDFTIPDMARAIRFAHLKGIRVIVRIPCFHDPLVVKKADRLAIKSTAGFPFHAEWLDPTNEEAQQYVLELVQEALDNGADEVQLDYIRFPVVGPVKQMKLPPPQERRAHQNHPRHRAPRARADRRRARAALARHLRRDGHGRSQRLGGAGTEHRGARLRGRGAEPDDLSVALRRRVQRLRASGGASGGDRHRHEDGRRALAEDEERGGHPLVVASVRVEGAELRRQVSRRRDAAGGGERRSRVADVEPEQRLLRRVERLSAVRTASASAGDVVERRRAFRVTMRM